MMKLLLPALILGMSVHAFAQIDAAKNTTTDISDKWVMTANNLKASTGRLLMDKPAGSKLTVYIYSMVGSKHITSFNQSNFKGLLALSPGDYKITINNAPVKNVRIKKGHDTKLETGVLDITVNAVWYLYDETGKASYTSGNKPEKLVLPVGNYRITLNNAPIENVRVKKGPDTKLKTGVLDITDNDVWYLYDESGQTSYTSGNKPDKLVLPIGNYTLKVGGNSKPVQVNEFGFIVGDQGGKIIETDQWIMTPLNKPIIPLEELTYLCDECDILVLPEENWGQVGLLYLDFPITSFSISDANINLSRCGTSICSDCVCPRYYPLKKGIHSIVINNVLVKDVPIMPKYETRLKMGLLKVISDKSWGVYDLSETIYYLLRPGSSEVYLPVGNYIYRDYKGSRQIQLKYLATTELIIPEEKKSKYKFDSAWSIYAAKGLIKKDSGILFTAFNDDFRWKLTWTSAPYMSMGNEYGNSSSSPKYFEPGTYSFMLNNVPIPDVPIIANKITKLKVGYFEFSADQLKWEIRDKIDVGKVYYYSISQVNKIVLPAGDYILRKDNHGSQYFFIKIEEGKILVR